MHILQANIWMWLDHQKSFGSWLQSMWAFFLARNPDFFRKNAEVESYLKYIDWENPDVVYLTEVCWIEQRDLLISGLNTLWYKTHTIEWFELWNMQVDSHRYLYHIMGSRIDFEHHQTVQQYTSNNVIKFLKRNTGLWSKNPTTRDYVSSILDWGGSRYSIWGIDVGLIHAHAMDSTHVFRWLMQWLASSGSSSQVMIWDMNMNTEWSERLANEVHSDMKRIDTNRTYPYYFSNIENPWILTRTIQNSMISRFLPYPDQAFINPIGTKCIETNNFWATQTWLKTDHSVNHFHIEVK